MGWLVDRRRATTLSGGALGPSWQGAGAVSAATEGYFHAREVWIRAHTHFGHGASGTQGIGVTDPGR